MIIFLASNYFSSKITIKDGTNQAPLLQISLENVKFNECEVYTFNCLSKVDDTWWAMMEAKTVV